MEVTTMVFWTFMLVLAVALGMLIASKPPVSAVPVPVEQEEAQRDETTKE
jgi:uncharacterized protein (DUF58 family)